MGKLASARPERLYMANQDTDTDIKDEDLDEEVETLKGEDESSDKDDSQDDVENTEDKNDDDSDDSEDDSDKDDSETEDEEEPEFKKRFTQIKGDNADEYIPNLEEAYRQSSTEAQRLALANKDQQSRLDKIVAATTRDPELAAKLNEALGDNTQVMVDPALLEARNTMEDRMNTEFNDFKEAHPEFDSDPVLQEQVLVELGTFSEAARKQGKMLSMKEGLKKAWISLGHEYEAPKKNSPEDIAAAAKRTAAKSRTSSKGKKPSSGSKLTPEQIAFGKKMGLTAKQLEENNK